MDNKLGKGDVQGRDTVAVGDAQGRAVLATHLQVEVVYATPERQVLVALQVAAGTSVGAAIAASGLLRECPEIRECLEKDLTQLRLGCWGKPCSWDTVLQAFDRIEIYRPLLADPKTVRRERAALAKARRKAG